MDLRLMNYFVVVAEELSISKAAERLQIEPSPLSRQITALEKKLGVPLLLRRNRSIRLTPAGQVFLKEARLTIAQIYRSVTLTRRAAEGGHLSVGYNPVAESSLLPEIVQAFEKKWPAVRLDLHGLRTPEQLAALSRGELDVGFVCPPIPMQECDLQELTTQPFVVGVPSGHRLADTPEIFFEALSHEPLVVYSRRLDPGAFEQLERGFTNAGATMNIVRELDTPLSMIHFAATDRVCCFVPDYLRKFQRDGVVFKTLSPPVVRTLAVMKRKGSEGLAGSFYRFVVERVSSAQVTSAGPRVQLAFRPR
jgi:DNA-binding transcriptional LysR family regulator